MPDTPEIDPFFGDMSKYPVVRRDELLPSEKETLEAIERGEIEESVPDEWYIEQFVQHFGYTPKIKEWNAFLFYVLSDFNPMWRDEAIEVEHERS